MKVVLDDSKDGLGANALLDDVGPFLLNFLHVFGLYNRAPMVKEA